MSAQVYDVTEESHSENCVMAWNVLLCLDEPPGSHVTDTPHISFSPPHLSLFRKTSMGKHPVNSQCP